MKRKKLITSLQFVDRLTHSADILMFEAASYKMFDIFHSG